VRLELFSGACAAACALLSVRLGVQGHGTRLGPARRQREWIFRFRTICTSINVCSVGRRSMPRALKCRPQAADGRCQLRRKLPSTPCTSPAHMTNLHLPRLYTSVKSGGAAVVPATITAVEAHSQGRCSSLGAYTRTCPRWFPPNHCDGVHGNHTVIIANSRFVNLAYVDGA
jgi:hypothetical protein